MAGGKSSAFQFSLGAGISTILRHRFHGCQDSMSSLPGEHLVPWFLPFPSVFRQPGLGSACRLIQDKTGVRKRSEFDGVAQLSGPDADVETLPQFPKEADTLDERIPRQSAMRRLGTCKT